MLDADDRFPDVEGAHIIRLGHTLDALGCAALPPLAEQRMRGLATRTRPFLEQAELVIIVAGLGGGTGTGASHEYARQAKLHGATVLSIASPAYEKEDCSGRNKTTGTSFGRLCPAFTGPTCTPSTRPG